MKTLKQWFDGLSEEAKKEVMRHCDDWLDTNASDYYKHTSLKEVTDRESLGYHLYDNFDKDSSQYRETKELYMRQGMMYKWLCTHHPEIMSKEDCDHALLNMLNGNNSSSILIFLINDEEKRIKAWVKKQERAGDNLTFWDWLYTLKDFSDIKLPDNVFLPNNTLTPGLIEILGHDYCYELAKDNYSALIGGLSYKKQSDLFDELFFCDNGWNDTIKKKVLQKLYIPDYGDIHLDQFEDFIQRIVAVDKKYLEFIKQIIDRYPALAMKVYNQKKPDSELTGNEKPSMLFRYSKEIRDLARIAAACSRRTISQANLKGLHEIGQLVKLYGYNFTDIYNAMYAQ